MYLFTKIFFSKRQASKSLLSTTLFLIVLILVASVNAQDVSSQSNVEPSTKAMKMDHSHMPIAVPSEELTPALSLALSKDAMSGYNLILKTARYSLTPPPQEQTMAQMMGVALNDTTGFVEGHAHLYINGIKIQRIYGHNVHLPSKLFKAGINIISVTLNNHGHMYWTAEKKKILATLYVNEAKIPFISYEFASFPVD